MNVAHILAFSMAFALCLGACTESHAGTDGTTFNFDITFDGVSPTVDAGSTNPVGVSLDPDDGFVVSVRASSGNFWRVDAPYSQFAPLSFIVNPSGERAGNTISSFLLNGAEVANIPELGVIQSEIHIGAQNWTLPEGLEFDTVIMAYSLLGATELGNSNPVATTIQSRPDIFSSLSSPERPFFRNSSISFNAIPEPATLCLTAVVLLGLGAIRRR